MFLGEKYPRALCPKEETRRSHHSRFVSPGCCSDSQRRWREEHSILSQYLLVDAFVLFFCEEREQQMNEIYQLLSLSSLETTITKSWRYFVHCIFFEPILPWCSIVLCIVRRDYAYAKTLRTHNHPSKTTTTVKDRTSKSS